MKKLEASYLSSVHKESSLQQISEVLDKLEKNSIEMVPWPVFSYKPEALFAIAYNDDGILIKYFVREKSIRAMYHRANEPVYKDSCVEFFISFDGEDEYYNFEFNCIGACLLGFGTGKSGRALLPEELIRKIRHLALIKNSNDSGIFMADWELTLMIPLEVFSYHQINSLKGRQSKVNF